MRRNNMEQDRVSSGIGTSTGSDLGTGLPGSAGRLASAGDSRLAGADLCPTCGRDKSDTNTGLEQFLGRLGISEEMVTNLKTSMQNVDVEEYLSTARQYLSDGTGKATSYARENPGKVAAGVAVLAVGAGLLISALNKD
jgi:hypothetical protein